LLDPNSPAGQTAKAQADQGSNLLKSKNYAAALPVLTQACDAGNPDGCDSLGFMYQEKLGVAQDYSKALTLYSRSCNSGEANGCDLVARLDHEILFDFDGALKANQQVVKISPTAGHTMDLMEAELTDAHFDDCIQLAATLNPPSLDAAHVLVRDTIKLACQFGAGQAADAAETSRLISSQARAAKRDTWDFTGTLHFVQTSPPFETVQSAWIALFTAVQKGDAAGIRSSLAALQPTLQ
jgi:TPR repeat protein